MARCAICNQRFNRWEVYPSTICVPCNMLMFSDDPDADSMCRLRKQDRITEEEYVWMRDKMLFHLQQQAEKVQDAEVKRIRKQWGKTKNG